MTPISDWTWFGGTCGPHIYTGIDESRRLFSAVNNVVEKQSPLRQHECHVGEKGRDDVQTKQLTLFFHHPSHSFHGLSHFLLKISPSP